MAGIVVLGISSSVSAYKACEILRGFQRAGCTVQVVMTRHATRLVTPLLLSTLSGRKAIVELFDETTDWSVAHVALASDAPLRRARHINVIAKFAAGSPTISDDLLPRRPVPRPRGARDEQSMLLHPRTRTISPA
jgi:phosphopantothenoylcysteine decarboxylase/phosphopantothenate--cysteine ligase